MGGWEGINKLACLIKSEKQCTGDQSTHNPGWQVVHEFITMGGLIPRALKNGFDVSTSGKTQESHPATLQIQPSDALQTVWPGTPHRSLLVLET